MTIFLISLNKHASRHLKTNHFYFFLKDPTFEQCVHVCERCTTCNVTQNKMTDLISENLKWYCMNFIRITLSCLFMTGAFGNLGTTRYGNVITPNWNDRHFFLTAGLPSVGSRTSIHSSQTFFTRVAVPACRRTMLSKTRLHICRYYNVSVTVTRRYPFLARYTGVRSIDTYLFNLMVPRTGAERR